MTPPTALSNRWTWVLAIVLLTLEFVVFDRMTSRYHASGYPRWTDQTQYLTEAYTAGRQLQEHGLWAGLRTTFTKSSVQGTVHDFFAVLVFWVAGSPSRSAVLGLNMLVLLAWQAAMLAVIPRVTGSRALGWAGFGLILCVAWPWAVDGGSAVDFRLDHAAMCLFGVSACCALLTDGFRSTRWSLAFGAVAALALLERFLTGVYFAFVFLFVAGWILAGDQRGRRLRNLALAGLVMVVIAGPVFWFNRAAIYNYYWVGHIASADADARAPHLGLAASLRYLFANLANRQLGVWFVAVVAQLTVLLGVALLARPRAGRAPVRREWGFLAAAFLLAPALVLTLHRQKSFYVLGVIVPGVILLVLWLWAELLARLETADTRWARQAPAALALAAGLAGGGYFLQRQLTPPHTPELAGAIARVNQEADHYFQTARAAGLAMPHVGIDVVVDYLDGRTLSVVCYERHKVWLPFSQRLPRSILAEPDDVIMAWLAECDFFLLTEETPLQPVYPYDAQLARLRPQLKAWCEQNLRRVDSFWIFNRRMSLYQRRDLP